MISTFINPIKSSWAELCTRPVFDNTTIIPSVQNIILTVQTEGDSALKDFAKKFDRVSLVSLNTSTTEINAAIKKIDKKLKLAIQQAYENIYTFHNTQKESAKKIKTTQGITCWRENRGIEKVGLYIPGGSAPLFSTVLMLGIPATIEGCKEIILCTPCNKDGEIHEAVLYAAHLCGIKKIFKVGGAQAIAAMAYGTESIPSVYKIFGPGNQYVTTAKQLVQNKVAIDMPAGPSEVLVIADHTAVPEFVAADLLAQAEHGSDSQVILVCTHKSIAAEVEKALQKQIEDLPRKEIAIKALTHARFIIVKTIKDAIAFSNKYAPEHLILSCVTTNEILIEITNAGSVFLGNYSPESVGDYASGTNHTLPTNGYAKAYSGVSLDSFVKKISFQKLSKKGLEQIADTVTTMAEAEGLQAHSNAVLVRLKK